ncbi:CHAT domain-containing protein [Actinocorallia sp. API 0066]|uniref:CHAT domain-containing protein n=1 Tax=Actinocorallia sp. API 0066 TaxID=2896846 RepID=UPI001E58A0F5|nr:CHAT domain-containing protein [Actinocorallia sp. API 0066]MCD0449688.1 CHAT domain-containing protein [Actinocorallia sp. API 0066]
MLLTAVLVTTLLLAWLPVAVDRRLARRGNGELGEVLAHWARTGDARPLLSDDAVLVARAARRRETPETRILVARYHLARQSAGPGTDRADLDAAITCLLPVLRHTDELPDDLTWLFDILFFVGAHDRDPAAARDKALDEIHEIEDVELLDRLGAALLRLAAGGVPEPLREDALRLLALIWLRTPGPADVPVRPVEAESRVNTLLDLSRLLHGDGERSADPARYRAALRATAEADALLARFDAAETPRSFVAVWTAFIAVKLHVLERDTVRLGPAVVRLAAALPGPLDEDDAVEARLRVVLGCEVMHEETSEPVWTARVVAALRGLIAAHPERAAATPRWRAGLAARLVRLFRADGDAADEDLVREAAELLDGLPDGDEEGDWDVLARGVAFFEYARSPTPRGESAIGRWIRRALDLAAAGDPGELRYAVVLLHEAYLFRARRRIVELAAPLLRPVLDGLDPGGPEALETGRMVAGLAIAPGGRTDPSVLADCAALLRPHAEGERPDANAVLLLAMCLRDLHVATGERALIGEARSALEGERYKPDAPGLDPQTRAYRLLVAGDVLFHCAVAEGSADGLVEAAAVLRRASEAVESDWKYAARLPDLRGQVLCALFEATGRDAFLDEAVTLAREAVAVSGAAHPESVPEALASLAYVLHAACVRDFKEESLTEALAVARAAVAAAPDSARARNNLSSLLRLAHVRTGDAARLDEAVEQLRHAVARTPDGHVDRAFYLMNLATGLLTRHDHEEDGFALAEAQELTAEVMRTLTEDAQHAPNILSTFCHLHYALFERHRDAALLASAIGAARWALGRVPDGDFRRPAVNNALAVLLTRQAELYGDPAPLVEAERLLVAVTGSPGTDPALTGPLFANLCATRLRLAERTGETAPLLAAEDSARRALADAPDAGEHRTSYLALLGGVLVLVHGRTGRPGALPEARALFAAVGADPDADPVSRFTAACGFADVAAAGPDPDAAVRAYGEAADLLSSLAPLAMGWTDRRMRLRHLSGLGARAARAALRAGDPRRAVELLERTRGVLLADGHDLREDLAALDERLPEAAAAYRALRVRTRLLDSAEPLAAGPAADGTAQAPGERARRERAELRDAWAELLGRVRAAPGFADFLRPPSFARLIALLDDVPVVMLVAGDDGGHALVVSREGVETLPLPALTGEAVEAEANALRAAVWSRSAEALADRLRWTWDAAVGPVLDALDARPPAGPGPRRVRWCPVGNVAYLPLHAAGHPGDARRSALDRAVSSAVPTLRMLGEVLGREPVAAPGVLVVAQPETPGAAPLRGVAREAEAISRLVPDARCLRGAEATRAAVLAEVARHPVGHFACHGVGDDLSGPSRLLLHDHLAEPLTVEALARLRLHADLAFLSACSSTDPVRGEVDESLHITGGFLTAGYRQVVGTLWPVADVPAALLAIAFYRDLTHGGTRPPETARAAYALREAVLKAREEDPGNPFTWAAYLHVGA